jgi:hypothetical protein
MAFCAPALSQPQEINSGHSAHWYNPERNGEGLILEILSEDSALVYWFTYDEDGEQRWLLDIGTIQDNEITFPNLTVTRGGVFGDDFDPEKIERITVGHGKLTFDGCNEATWSYSAFDQAETIRVLRLTTTMGVGCQPINGIPGFPVQEYAGQSGSWFDPERSGEGYIVQWMSRDQAVVIWFTYDDEGNQFWLTGVGSRVDGRLHIPTLYSASGPSFGPTFDANLLELHEWGELTLDLSCSSGDASYASIRSEFGSGGYTLSRLTALAGPACPYQQPRLADLYEFEIVEIDFSPLASGDGPSFRDMNFRATDVASDGTVVGIRPVFAANHTFVWDPDSQITSLSQQGTFSEDTHIKPDATESFTSQMIDSDGQQDGTTWIPVRAESGGPEWMPISDNDFSGTLLYGLSHDGERLVGAQVSEMRVPWTWSPEGGQEIFALSDGFQSGFAEHVSNDGSALVGYQSDFSLGFRQDYATRWVKGEEPEFLTDDEEIPLGYALTCDATCSIVPGSQQLLTTSSSLDPNSQSFWLWTETRGFQYLPDEFPNAIDSSFPPSRLVFDTSADGSLFVGRYLALISTARQERPVVWTQRTGLESLFEVLNGTEGWDENWDDVAAVAVSSDGTKILLSGDFRQPPISTAGAHGRAMVVSLIPKSD